MAEAQDWATDVGATDVDYKKMLGTDEGGLVDTAGNAVECMAGTVADKLDPVRSKMPPCQDAL